MYRSFVLIFSICLLNGILNLMLCNILFLQQIKMLIVVHIEVPWESKEHINQTCRRGVQGGSHLLQMKLLVFLALLCQII